MGRTTQLALLGQSQSLCENRQEGGGGGSAREVPFCSLEHPGLEYSVLRFYASLVTGDIDVLGKVLCDSITPILNSCQSLSIERALIPVLGICIITQQK